MSLYSTHLKKSWASELRSKVEAGQWKHEQLCYYAIGSSGVLIYTKKQRFADGPQF